VRQTRRLLLAVVLAASFAAPARAVTWNVLVAAFPKTQIDCDASGDMAHIVFSQTLTSAKIATMRTATENYARLVASWSNGARSVAVDFVVIDDPITCVTNTGIQGSPSYWVAPEDLFLSRLPELVASGEYDSVFVLWDSGEGGEIPTPAYAGISSGSPIDLGGRIITYSTVPWTTFNNPLNAVFLYSPEVMVHEWLHPMPAFYRDSGGYASPDADEATTYGYPADANGSFATFYRDVLRGRVVDTSKTPQSYTGISDSVWAFGATQHPAPADPPRSVQLLAPQDYDCASTTPTLAWRAVPGAGIGYLVSIFDATNPSTPVVALPSTGTSLTVPMAAGLQPFGVYAWSVQAVSGASMSAFADRLHFIAGGTTATPVISPNGGPLPTTGGRIHISPGGVAAPIRYTVDGSDPGTSSTLLGADGELEVTPPATVKARAFGVSSCGASPIATADFAPPSPIVVTKTDDSGAGTLREALTTANSNPGKDSIVFEIPGAGVHTIAPQSPLPVQTEPVIIDGWAGMPPGYSGPPVIELNGAGAGVSDGLSLEGGDSLIRGLVVNGWNGNGIQLSVAGGDRIVGCRIGTSADGTSAVPNTRDGVYIESIPGNVIGDSGTGDGNLLSGNGIRGIEIYNAAATGNVIQSNLIGTNADGTAAIPNALGGVAIFAAPRNVVGGSLPSTRNVISGNGTGAPGSGDGVTIAEVGATGNVVIGNFIGVSKSGSQALGNSRNGVIVSVSDSGSISASGNEVGSPFEGNVISGNGANGVAIVGEGGGGEGNVVHGNLIGTDWTGFSPLGNGASGVTITRGLPFELTPSGNLIGGTAPGDQNVISGNHVDGVTIVGQSATGNVVQGNYIGTDASGTVAMGNTRSGVRLTTAPSSLSDTASNNQIGGTSGGATNLISGNGANGVALIGNLLGGSGNRIEGNWIGLDLSGSGAIPNGVDGVLISTVALNGVATANVVGGAYPGAGNLIEGHPGAGVKLEGAGAASNTVAGNFIGVTDVGDAFGNAGPGVSLSSSPNNAVTANTVRSNGGGGLLVSSATGDRLSQNSIFANGGLGIDLQNANASQPAPLIASAVASTATLVSGSLTAAPSTIYLVELFSSPSCDASGSGEGAAFLGSASVQTAANGAAALQTVMPTPLALGSVVTATATDPNGNTSTFSPCATVASGPPNDGDGDGVLNASDDCPMVPDAAQSDSGGVGGTAPDGIGDVCQCGDVTLDGAVTASDVTLYREHLANPTGIPFLADTSGKCSVFGALSSQCDIVDLVVLRRALAGRLPGVAQVCRSSSGS
jgi:Chitobiase/beta-hexosaminidase C-terminal domain